MEHTTSMREMRENIAVVQPCHGNFGDDHLKEGREGREDTKFIGLEPETSCSREVSSFHDSGRDENLRMLLVNDFQTGRAFQVT